MRYIDLQSIRFVTTIKRNVDANQTSFPLSVFCICACTVLPVERVHCSFRRASERVSFGAGIRHTLSQRLQTYPQTCFLRTGAFGSEESTVNMRYLCSLRLYYWSPHMYDFFTPSAGLRPGDTSWPLWAPWMRCLWTSSLADGSVQKWSDVLSLVYSRAQGPTIDEKILISHKTNYVIKKNARVNQ